jgi:hypothetical protein
MKITEISRTYKVTLTEDESEIIQSMSNNDWFMLPRNLEAINGITSVIMEPETITVNVFAEYANMWQSDFNKVMERALSK